jgi:hypothetical protein
MNDRSLYQYAVMKKDGKYQWRWLEPLPPEVKGAEMSPVFDSMDAAAEWASKNLGKMVNPDINEGWSLV